MFRPERVRFVARTSRKAAPLPQPEDGVESADKPCRKRRTIRRQAAKRSLVAAPGRCRLCPKHRIVDKLFTALRGHKKAAPKGGFFVFCMLRIEIRRLLSENALH